MHHGIVLYYIYEKHFLRHCIGIRVPPLAVKNYPILVIIWSTQFSLLCHHNRALNSMHSYPLTDFFKGQVKLYQPDWRMFCKKHPTLPPIRWFFVQWFLSNCLPGCIESPLPRSGLDSSHLYFILLLHITHSPLSSFL